MVTHKKNYQFTVHNTTFNFDNWYEFLNLYIEIFLIQEYRFKSKKKMPVILDCGAHIGLASLYFKHKYPAAKILAFEPMPKNAQFFSQNIKSNNLKGVKLTAAALGRKNGTVFFYTSGKHDPSWGNSLVRENIHTDTIQKIKVTVAKLSPYITKKIDFMKMDIEGAEADVLREIGPKIQKVQEMVIEIHNQSGTTTTFDFVTNFLREHGFKIKTGKPLRTVLTEKIDTFFGRTPSDIYMLRAWK